MLDEFSPGSGELGGPLASGKWRGGSGGAGDAGLRLLNAPRFTSFSSGTSTLGVTLRPLYRFSF